MKYYNNIIEAYGNTPLVKLNKVAKGIKGTVLVKVEYLNPGQSMKDRMAVQMIDDAEAAGLLKPGGTIIEGTSGNTGMGLALVAIARGYKCIFTISDKQSQEKVDALRAVGAEVVVCPTNVSPDDPRSYYSVSRKLKNETPNSIYPNQYDNPGNATAHYKTTGPEIWDQTDGKITVYAAGVGTGGSMCGTAKFLKEQNPAVKTVGIDTYGSVFKKLKETGIFDENEIYPYMTEGIGEDILPKNVDMDLIDQFIKVTDKDGAIMTRRLAKEEGLFLGWSSGSAVYGALEWAKDNMKEDDVMVIILPDHGMKYLKKIYNDDWMKNHGYLEERGFATARDIVKSKNGSSALEMIDANATVADTIKAMSKTGISQMPVVENGEIVGSISESNILVKILENPEIKSAPVKDIMGKAFMFVGLDNTVDALSSLVDKNNKALLVRDEANNVHIITQSDLLLALSN